MKIGINTTDPQHEFDIRANVYISGNLTVKGNTFIIDTTHLVVDDPIIELGANRIAGITSVDSGVLMNRGPKPQAANSANVFLGFEETRKEVAPIYTTANSSVSLIPIVGYTDFRANSAIFAVEGDTKKTSFFIL